MYIHVGKPDEVTKGLLKEGKYSDATQQAFEGLMEKNFSNPIDFVLADKQNHPRGGNFISIFSDPAKTQLIAAMACKVYSKEEIAPQKYLDTMGRWNGEQPKTLKISTFDKCMQLPEDVKFVADFAYFVHSDKAIIGSTACRDMLFYFLFYDLCSNLSAHQIKPENVFAIYLIQNKDNNKMAENIFKQIKERSTDCSKSFEEWQLKQVSFSSFCLPFMQPEIQWCKNHGFWEQNAYLHNGSKVMGKILTDLY